MPLTHVCVWDSKIGYRRITVMEYYEMKEDGGKTVMTGNSNKMAFQIPEELFQQIKWHPALPLGRPNRHPYRRPRAQRTAVLPSGHDLEGRGGDG